MAIKVKDLIEELQRLNPDDFVVMSYDAEGNGYSFLEGIYTNHRLFEGEVYLAELTPELKADGYTEEDVSDNGVNCVVFYPAHDAYLVETLLTGMKKE